MKRITVLLALVALIAALCAGPAWAQAEWTIMVYMNGDNDLEGKIIGDLNEMEQATISSSINVIVQIDRAVGYDATNGDWTTCRRYKVVKDANTAIIGSSLIQDIGEVDMGSPQTLADFAKWTIEKYPAKKYSLIMSDHGSGWSKGGDQDGMKGFSHDYSSGNTIDVSNGEFGNAMRQITDYLKQVTNDPNRKLDHIAWDACLMGMWEVLDIAKDYANYANVSEQVMVYPPGYDYNNFLASVSATPTMDARYLGIHLLGVNTDGQHTKSLIDLSKIDALTIKIDKFAQELQASRASYGAAITTALNNTLKFYYTTHIDLGDFAVKIYNSNVPASLKTAAAECSVAVKNARATTPMNSGAHANAHGIAIYHNNTEAFNGNYSLLPIAGKTCWDEYLQNKPAHAGLWIFPTSPQNGDMVFGGTFIKIHATDPDGIKKIEYYVDGVLQATSYQSPYYYEVKWPSKAVECKIVAKAYDNLNNTNAATLVIRKAQGADSYYNKLNVGGSVSVIDPVSGATVAFTLAEIYVADGVRKARISISNQPTINDAQAGKMYKVGGLFIYPATLFIGTETFSQIMIAPYQYPSLDIITPEPNISTNNCIVMVATNYSGKNVPWNGIGNAPTNADLLKTLSFNESAAQYAENFTWVMSGTNGPRTMKVNMRDSLGATVSKSVTVNYNSSLPFDAYFGPYGDDWKRFSLSYYVAGGTTYARGDLWDNSNTNRYWTLTTTTPTRLYSKKDEIAAHASELAKYINGPDFQAPIGAVKRWVVDKNQYDNSTWSSGFGFGTITYKDYYGVLAGTLGKDSQGRTRVWASTSAGSRSSIDAITCIRLNGPGAPSYSSNESNKITLNWDDLVGETGYQVQRGKGINPILWSDVGQQLNSNVTSYIDNTVKADSTYSYRLVGKVNGDCDRLGSESAITARNTDGIINGNFNGIGGWSTEYSVLCGDPSFPYCPAYSITTDGIGSISSSLPCNYYRQIAFYGYIRQQIIVPIDACSLSYDISSGRVGSSSMGVRFGNSTLGYQDYSEPSTAGWVRRCWVMPTNYRGQQNTIELYLEQGSTFNQYYAAIQLDNIKILTNRFVSAPSTAAGANHSVALKTDGTVWAWGLNTKGQLGDSTVTQRTAPVKAKVLTNAMAVAAGDSHSVAIKSDGTVWAWGYNGYGQLGDSTVTQRNYPVKAKNLTGVIAVAGGAYHSLALKSDGTVWAWGRNNYYQLGDSSTTQRNYPVKTKILSGVVAIAAGEYYSMALKGDGTVWAWGYNVDGQLGVGDTLNRTAPVQITTLSGIVALKAGSRHALVIKSDGKAWAWGRNVNGQLGDSTTTKRKAPVQVKVLSNVTAINGGYNYSLAVKSDGTAWAWGYNNFYQLGDSSTTQRTYPVRTKKLTNAKSVAAGVAHSLAAQSDGTVWAWGRNSNGQLGLGDTTRRYAPVQITGMLVKSAADFETGDDANNEIIEIVAPLQPAMPLATRLYQSHPNPFTGQTSISFQLVAPAQTTIKVYNISGQLVKTLVSECLRPGYHSVRWDGKDANGNKVAAGVYLYRMQAGDYTKTNKMTVVR